ncbi:alpha/beta hydrolase [Rhizosphaericola mali]|uniref:Alpha/beta hydrolase n=2 Tax=Rhizosphaericola mali TaxID=2545455 RepID=A0A5P2G9E8_9BACT|nr:alpha/beta hydrolase [Rhizosphaericola mali]
MYNPPKVLGAQLNQTIKNESFMNIELPEGIRERYIDDVNGLKIHVLEAGFETQNRPSILLIHGFPELAYSWRKIMVPLSDLGYHVIAYDQRGYGRTTGWDDRYDGDYASFRTHELARDALGLVMALGFKSVHSVIGHDVGAMVAAYCALVRPDVFQSLILLSCPFGGVPELPFDIKDNTPKDQKDSHPKVDPLSTLPIPKIDSTSYFSTRNANDDMLNCKQGLHDFQRAYFYVKSADWKENKPFALTSLSAEELAKQPMYYVLDKGKTMPEEVAPYMPSEISIASCKWLPENELDMYTSEFTRTGFQGGLNWYRCNTGGLNRADLELFSGHTIDIPSCFITGVADWATYRPMGALEQMQQKACTKLLDFHFVKEAGHWIQQERPEILTQLIACFLNKI